MAITFTNGITVSNYLYPFTSFRFTTAGISGSTGPLGTTLLAAYTGSSSGSYFSNPTFFTTGSYQGYQIWTVPQTATYEIEIAGAATGNTTYPAAVSGSKGAIVKARVPLTQGQKFVMVVGQKSLNTGLSGLAYIGLGGGGGSFFVLSGSNTPYLVAGGAGGYGAYSGDSMGMAGILKSGSLSGNGSTATTGSLSKNNAPGGTGSLGGRSHINTASVTSTNVYDGGGGGGFLGNGFPGNNTIAATAPTPAAQTGGGGMAFVSGAVGGGASTTYTPNSATAGGFGGGGGGGPIAGGGGGGYAGGAGTWGNSQPASDGAGGGSSYIISLANTISTSNGNYDGLSTFSGSSITNLNSFNSGSGYIQITKL
jgi:hypothetical protein